MQLVYFYKNIPGLNIQICNRVYHKAEYTTKTGYTKRWVYHKSRVTTKTGYATNAGYIIKTGYTKNRVMP